MRHLRFVRFACATAVVALAIAAFAASPAAAGLLGCGATSQPFAPWGDTSSYYFAANGGFESGSTGWTLSPGAKVVAGNESFDAHAATDSRSLLLPAGGTAATNVCYGVTYPAVRFFVSSASGAPVTVRVRVSTRNLLGTVSVLDGGSFTAYPGWDAGPKLSTLCSALVSPFGTKSMQLEISTSGAVYVDDLYVDPFRTG
jgi:hypothetical protein